MATSLDENVHVDINKQKLTHLIQCRGQIKAKVTNFRKFLSNLESTPNLTQLSLRFAKFEPLLNEYEAIYFQISEIDDHPSHDEDYSTFDASYYQILEDVQKIYLSEESQVNPPLSLRINQSVKHINQLPQTNNSHISVKLPTINLPSFAGNYEQWMTFKETFNALITQNLELNDTQRFLYLKSCLKDEASKIVESLAINVENYHIAWELLTNRFQNDKLIIRSHINNLFNLHNIEKGSPNSIRNLIDQAELQLKVLKTLGLPTDQWDVLIVYLITSKLDTYTKTEWEKESKAIPQFKDLKTFLNNRCQTLEALEFNKSNQCKYNSTTNKENNYFKKPYFKQTSSHVSNPTISCPYCKEKHLIFYCPKFLNLSVQNRVDKAKQFKLCLNCFKCNHKASNCTSGSCKICGKNHNTLLHQEINISQSVTDDIPSTSISNHSHIQDTQILLSTAVIEVFNKSNMPIKLRALLDSGSQNSFITEDAFNKLQLKASNINLQVTGINQHATSIKKVTDIKFKSIYDNTIFSISCFILPQITSKLPLKSFNITNFKIPKGIQLADPSFNISKNVDILIGSDIFWNLMGSEKITVNPNFPILYQTSLGFVISGAINTYIQGSKTSVCNLTFKTLEKQIAKFWEMEDYGNKTLLSSEEKDCEAHFKNTHKRAPNGQFIVRLPFKSQVEPLGNSRDSAYKRFLSLENKFSKNKQLQKDYTAFMNEYISLGHMELISKDEHSKQNDKSFFLPHHAVLRPESTSTKLRVVFDGSAKSSNGISLNDNLLVGPTIQLDLFSIVIRFRTHKFVLTADITKMYRQVLVHPEDTNFQLIFWRDDKQKPLQTFRLNTVTYGTSSAPYLSVKCLQQLAIENMYQYPTACQTIIKDFYVDDMLTGANTIENLIVLRDQVTNILHGGGFELCKWTSNSPEVIPNKDEDTIKILNKDDSNISKALGLLWDSHNDTFLYKMSLNNLKEPITKRNVLSIIAQLYDPLGLLGSLVVTGKILLQKLWSGKLNWDDPIPEPFLSKWKHFINDLQSINSLKIPRKLNTNSSHDNCTYEIHGFCDSSESAYGACLYLKSTSQSGEISVNLICSKSRVAPLKVQTLPRLELCGAVILARLVKKILNIINLQIANCTFWTDSMIVLSWLASPANTWTTYVANRVAEIQQLTELNQWKHVNTTCNPADLISRGITTQKLIQSKLWWHGPQFLVENISIRETNMPLAQSEIPEKRKSQSTITLTTTTEWSFLTQYSNFTRLQRVLALILRFNFNCKNPKHMQKGILTCEELNQSQLTIFKLVQKDCFSKELSAKVLSKNSKLLPLNPFVSKSDGLLRVGGRIKNSNFYFDKKHPVILPANHHISNLLIQQEHERQLHSGTQTTLCALRQRVWILSGKNAVKKVISKCMKCFRANPKLISQQMGNLPEQRLQKFRPFLRTGIDYAGPVLIKEAGGRGKRTVKAYIALFICFATKAIHLELVGNLTTDSFVSAFKRFVARRGFAMEIFSDNGTNFVGAASEIKKLLKSKSFQTKIITEFSNQNIKWHFIPPRSPHFGGLWEAGIKSVKYHIKRISGNALLTFEEMYTLLSSIESCLNSRPLCQISNDPNDLSPLTPGHFLIGEALTAIPEEQLESILENRLSRWQKVTKLKQHFWARWSKEYIVQLQQRTKWHKPQQITKGDLVMIHEDNRPPLSWRLGRIIELHPGSDGLVRVVSLRTANGVIKRCINKVCVLPQK